MDLVGLATIPIVKKTVSTNDLTDYVQKDFFINQTYFPREADAVSTNKDDTFSDSCISECLGSLKEVMSEYVKKKTKLIFFADRLIKIYENGYFAYFTCKKEEMKALIKPKQLISVSLDGTDKMKIVTKKKTYLFKFQNPKKAKLWVQELNSILLKSLDAE